MIKKTDIETLLIQLDGVVKNGEHSKQIGLLNENCGLGLKRRLRKIHNELLVEWRQFISDNAEVQKIDDEIRRKEEYDKLLSETFELKSEPVLMSDIEKIDSSFNYNFELLELIAK